jgi:hypothetical protein
VGYLIQSKSRQVFTSLHEGYPRRRESWVIKYQCTFKLLTPRVDLVQTLNGSINLHLLSLSFRFSWRLTENSAFVVSPHHTGYLNGAAVHRGENYSRITSTKSPPFCTTTFSASLTNLTTLLRQSRDCSCYVSNQYWHLHRPDVKKHTDLRKQDFAHHSYLWHQPRLANVIWAWSWKLCGINLVTQFHPFFTLPLYEANGLLHTLAIQPLGKYHRYPQNRRFGCTQNRSGRFLEDKTSPVTNRPKVPLLPSP